MQDNKIPYWVYSLGLIPTIWLALLIAPIKENSLFGIIKEFNNINFFRITWTQDSFKTIFLFSIIYIFVISHPAFRRKEKAPKTDHK